jgi:lysophospholipase L1-like esterase
VIARLAIRAAALAAALLPCAALAAEPNLGPELCAAPPGWAEIMAPLERLAARIREGGPLDIVAVGSSSTAGTGASSPAMAYPSRLEAALRERLPALDIHVVNRGKGGEDAPEELARLATDVVAAHPDLAIWQVGTNAVLRRDDIAADGEWMREGIELMQKNGIDVVLMDLQYAPRVLDRPAYATMQDLISETADHAHAGLFRRFSLMRYWQRTHAPDAPAMVGADGLHMTDAGYGCLAIELAAALEGNWRANEKIAGREHTAADAMAGLPSVARANGSAEPADMRRNDATPHN